MNENKELTVSNGNGEVVKSFTSEDLQLLKDTVCEGSTDNEFKLFVNVCSRTGLNPFARQIHAVKRWNSKLGRNEMSIQTGIDGYRLIADRTGLYAGNDDYKYNGDLTLYNHLQTGEVHPITATSTVYKLIQGHRVPFTATAAWAHYYPGKNDKGKEISFLWLKMPHVMLGKCAEALALRKAFPAELSGLYTDTEMAQAGNNKKYNHADEWQNKQPLKGLIRQDGTEISEDEKEELKGLFKQLEYTNTQIKNKTNKADNYEILIQELIQEAEKKFDNKAEEFNQSDTLLDVPPAKTDDDYEKEAAKRKGGKK
jgi:phage recombination protein Bet